MSRTTESRSQDLRYLRWRRNSSINILEIGSNSWGPWLSQSSLTNRVSPMLAAPARVTLAKLLFEK